MNIFIMSTVDIKLMSSVGIKLMLHIDINNILDKIVFNQNCFHQTIFPVVISRHILDIILTSCVDVHIIFVKCI